MVSLSYTRSKVIRTYGRDLATLSSYLGPNHGNKHKTPLTSLICIVVMPLLVFICFGLFIALSVSLAFVASTCFYLSVCCSTFVPTYLRSDRLIRDLLGVRREHEVLVGAFRGVLERETDELVFVGARFLFCSP